MMRRCLLGLALAAAVSGCATHQAAMGAFVGCHAADYFQTEWALENGYREANPLLGDHPSDSTLIISKLLALGLATWVYEYGPKESRTTSLLLATLPCAYVVGHNAGTFGK